MQINLIYGGPCLVRKWMDWFESGISILEGRTNIKCVNHLNKSCW